MKTSEIKFTVTLDENRMPASIRWSATDAEFEGEREADAALISIWDKDDKVTLGLDVWTKDMLINDMNIHFHQVILKLADTCQRATNNTEAAEMIKKFGEDFARKLKLLGS